VEKKFYSVTSKKYPLVCAKEIARLSVALPNWSQER